MRFYPFIFLLFFISCEPGGPGSKPVKKIEADPESMKLFKEVQLDAYFKLEIPQALEKTDILNKEAETQYYNLHFQFGLLIMNEDLNEAKNAMKILKPVLDESKVDSQFIDHYIQFQINKLKTVVHAYDYPVVAKTEISERDARTFEITADINNADFRMVISGTVVEGRSQVYYIYMFYPTAKQKEYLPAKNHILESFQLDERAYKVASEGDRLENSAIDKPEKTKLKGNSRKK